jgi:hypothetical protein
MEQNTVTLKIKAVLIDMDSETKPFVSGEVLITEPSLPIEANHPLWKKAFELLASDLAEKTKAL